MALGPPPRQRGGPQSVGTTVPRIRIVAVRTPRYADRRGLRRSSPLCATRPAQPDRLSARRSHVAHRRPGWRAYTGPPRGLHLVARTILYRTIQLGRRPGENGPP